jgi:heme exporter protein C
VSFKGTTMHVAMFQGMLLMALACWMYSIGAALVRVRSIILERESRTRWVRELGNGPLEAIASPGVTK